MTPGTGFRGQPLIAAVLVLGMWLGTRIVNWEAPPGIGTAQAFAPADGTVGLPGEGAVIAAGPYAGQMFGPQSYPPVFADAGRAAPAIALIPTAGMAAMPARQWRALLREIRAEFARNRLALPAIPAHWGPIAAREWAGLTGETAPARPALAAAPYPEALPTRADAGPSGARRIDRWSADAWALVRSGTAQPLASGIYPATYGASQAGSILRYRFAPDNRHRPTAYLRTTSTLGGIQETTAALGILARPVASLPLVAAIEGRITDQAGTRRVQPAAMAITELPPVSLPHGFRGEFYGQGGYVGGKFATAFADGQLRVDRELITIGPAEARIGAGAWGGVQKGASRIDVGPSATLGLPVKGTTSARVGIDWRIRVGGNAEPESGPALTVSAGF